MIRALDTKFSVPATTQECGERGPLVLQVRGIDGTCPIKARQEWAVCYLVSIPMERGSLCSPNYSACAELS